MMRAPRDSLTRVQSLAKESLVPLPALGELMLEPLLEIVTTPTALMLQNTSFPRICNLIVTLQLYCAGVKSFTPFLKSVFVPAA